MVATLPVDRLPLNGVKVVEFVHMVMGPTCGLILADLGADVIKVEPVPDGDNTRRLPGSGAGFFITFNRNKRSLAIDVKSPRGQAVIAKLLAGADVLTENFRPGAMARLGLDWDSVHALNPRLVYCSLKGFLPGPYEHRAALDEVVQMMGGLAYMTGLPDRPLRAGSSVNDIMGGMFAAIAILAALRDRDQTGIGRHVQSSLFENCVFLVAQHMTQYAVTGVEAPPMSIRQTAWGIYDIFETADGERLFVGVVTDTQWRQFCAAFDRPDLAADAELATNRQRVAARARLIPEVESVFRAWTKAALMEKVEAIGLPFAPVTKPVDLFDDPHLTASGGLVPTILPDGRASVIPGLPIAIDGARLPRRTDAPRLGDGSRDILQEIGFTREEIDSLVQDGIIGEPATA